MIDAKYQSLGNRIAEEEFQKYLKYHKLRGTCNTMVRARCVCLLFPNSSNRSEPTVTLSIDGLQWNDTKTLPRVVEDFEMLHSITPPRSESDWTTDSLATAESVQFVHGLLALHGLKSAKDA